MHFDVVIVGGGHGGAAQAAQLRQKGFTGSLAIITAEPELPYERPPLSKDYLAGEKSFERMLLRPPAFWAERNVEVMTGTRVTAVDAAAHRLATTAGDIGYGQLVWAAGGDPRRLSCPGHELPGLHAIRTRADVDALKADLKPESRVLVVGGGYIGLESAAVLSKLGHSVTVIEAMDRVMARVAGPALSAFYEAEHRAHGVEIVTGAGLASLAAAGGAKRAVSVLGRIVEHVDVLVGNEEDLQKGLGMRGPEVTAKSALDPSTFIGMIERVVARYPQMKVVATTLREVHSTNRHSWGAVAWISGDTYVAPTCEVDVYDRVGGGDGFAAGLIYGLMSGETPEDAVRLGWAHGALVATFPGDTTMATLDQVRAFARGGSARIQR